MKYAFSWKKALLTAVLFAVVGIGLFATVGSRLDENCVLNNTPGTGCSIYRGWNTFTHAYGAFWLQFIAPQCVGDNGPDDCIGPAISVMFFTLIGAGAIIGGFSKKKDKPDRTSPQARY